MSDNNTLPAVTRLVEQVDTTDEAIIAKCQLAKQLATALDDAVMNGENAAVPGLSKELRAALDEVSSVEGRKAAFVSAIFGEM